jgi:hypothetical protein
MNAFRVWIWPLDYEFLICVDGVTNARWLLDQLGRSFVFRSSQPISQDRNSALCAFQVPCGPMLTLAKLQRMLAEIPEVTLLRVAAVN